MTEYWPSGRVKHQVSVDTSALQAMFSSTRALLGLPDDTQGRIVEQRLDAVDTKEEQ